MLEGATHAGILANMIGVKTQFLAALLLFSLFALAEQAEYEDLGDGNEVHYLWSGVYIIPSHSVRSNFFGGDGYLVAYPSIGGVVLAKPSAIDLQYLGIARTHDEKRSSELDPREEDDLAARMLRLGAHWWPDWDTYLRHRSQIDGDILYDFHFPPELHVGYPSTGGVWVAKFTQDQQWFDEDSGWKPWLPRRPDAWRTRMHYVLTMDEKCNAMKDMGAMFYDKVEDCPDIAKTADEGRDMFKPYGELLEKMDDNAYRNRWFAGAEENTDDAIGSDDGSGTKRWWWWKPF